MPVSPPPLVTPTPRQLLVADSFRARTGERATEVRGFALHVARFRAAAIEATIHATSAATVKSNIASNQSDLAPRPHQLDEFLADAATRIDAAGEGFPRLELWATGKQGQAPGFELSLALRPLPEIRSAITLRTAALPSIVTHPARKGPNIAAYSALGHELGCEGLLLDDHGTVVEGTTTSLVWWDDAGRGYVSASTQRVPSVTEALVARIAHGWGTSLTPVLIAPEQLAGCAVWAVNALHGIRPVLSIDGRVPARQDPDRLAHYRSALDGMWEPVRA